MHLVTFIIITYQIPSYIRREVLQSITSKNGNFDNDQSHERERGLIRDICMKSQINFQPPTLSESVPGR